MIGLIAYNKEPEKNMGGGDLVSTWIRDDGGDKYTLMMKNSEGASKEIGGGSGSVYVNVNTLYVDTSSPLEGDGSRNNPFNDFEEAVKRINEGPSNATYVIVFASNDTPTNVEFEITQDLKQLALYCDTTANVSGRLNITGQLESLLVRNINFTDETLSVVSIQADLTGTQKGIIVDNCANIYLNIASTNDTNFCFVYDTKNVLIDTEGVSLDFNNCLIQSFIASQHTPAETNTIKVKNSSVFGPCEINYDSKGLLITVGCEPGGNVVFINDGVSVPEYKTDKISEFGSIGVCNKTIY